MNGVAPKIDMKRRWKVLLGLPPVVAQRPMSNDEAALITRSVVIGGRGNDMPPEARSLRGREATTIVLGTDVRNVSHENLLPSQNACPTVQPKFQPENRRLPVRTVVSVSWKRRLVLSRQSAAKGLLQGDAGLTKI